MSARPDRLEGAAASGMAATILAGFRRNLLPGLCIQGLAVGVLALYHAWPAAQPVFAGVAQAKAAGGLAASAVVVALCSGLVPWLVLNVRGAIPAQRRWRDLAFFLGVWAVLGIETDLLYGLQVLLFGSQADLATVVRKVAFDQGVVVPLWSLPHFLVAWRWRMASYSWRRLAATWSLGPFLREAGVLTVSAWLVWIPTMAIVYSMPSGLQFPLFCLVSIFWSLLAVTLGDRDA